MEWKSGKFKLELNSAARYGEQIAAHLLREDGWEIEPFPRLLYRKKKCSKIGTLVELCKKDCPLRKNLWGDPVIPLCEKFSRDYSFIWQHCNVYLSQFCPQVCKRLCKNRMALKIEQEVRDKYRESPGLDFVAYKDKETYAVEVKTGRHRELKIEQREFAERLQKELGIGLLVVHVIINDELTYELTYSAELRYCLNKLR